MISLVHTMTSRELLPLPESCCPLPFVATPCRTRHRRSIQRQAQAVTQWPQEVFYTLNSVYGHGSAAPGLRPSAAQVSGLSHVERVLRDLGPPPCSPAAAHRELCGYTPGYACTPENRASYTEGRVSLPSAGPHCKAEDVLKGDALELWAGWERLLLRDANVSPVNVKPFSDPKLVRDRRTYARFIGELIDCHVVVLGEYASETVGLFFVPKGKGELLRLIFDTRVANVFFSWSPTMCSSLRPGLGAASGRRLTVNC